jgi:hypothetical protein
VSLALAPPHPALNADWVIPCLGLAVGSFILEFAELASPLGSTLSATGPAHIALAIIAPPPFGAILVGASVFAQQALARRGVRRTAFNTANLVTATSLASAIFVIAGVAGHDVIQSPLPASWLALVAGAASYFVANASMTSVVISLGTGRRYRDVFWRLAGSAPLPDLAGLTLGGLVAVVWYATPEWSILLPILAWLVLDAARSVRALELETTSAVELLANTLDERDPTTHHHSQRVAVYAEQLALEATHDDNLADLVSLAARAHDLGKVGVRDAILFKPGRLDADEEIAMQRHTEIGYRILAAFRRYREGARLVRAHHERWDGRGYPDGLSGTQIPLGARILGVADSFDAMTSTRPYRAAMSEDEALEELLQGAGSQFDPDLAPIFVGLRRRRASSSGGPARD